MATESGNPEQGEFTAACSCTDETHKGIRRRDAKVVDRQERSGSVAGRIRLCRATRLRSSVRSCKEKAHNGNSWGCRRCGGNLQNVVCRMVTKRGNSAQSKRTVVCSCTEEIRNSNSTWCWNCAGMPRNCEGGHVTDRRNAGKAVAHSCAVARTRLTAAIHLCYRDL